jgi:hypothetical protein
MAQMKQTIGRMFGGLLALIVASSGCSDILLFNPAFINQRTGDVFPLVPSDRAGFVLARANNTTSVPIEFVITAERRVPSVEDPDTFVLELETRRVLTQPVQSANDMGVLFNCEIDRLGLGEILDRPTTEPGIFVNAEAVGAGGFGVPPNANPLSQDAENFDCGDTVIFVASESNSVAGGVVISIFLLDDELQPQEVRGLDTFVNARTLIEEQSFEEE